MITRLLNVSCPGPSLLAHLMSRPEPVLHVNVIIFDQIFFVPLLLDILADILASSDAA